MKFHGTGSPLSTDGFANAMTILGVDAATLWTLLSVETCGFGFLPSRRPVMHFERHHFHRLTNGRFDVNYPALSDPAPGGHDHPTSEYARLKSAAMLDADAALQSASWGIGQLMGCKYRDVGYATVHQMVDAMKGDEDEQLRATATFIRDWTMHEALQQHDWRSFSRWYNHRNFGRDKYGHDSYGAKLAHAHAHYRQWLPDLGVRSAQVALVYLGCYSGPIDGIKGPRTSAAVIAFQRTRQLRVTGRLNARMMDTLLDAAFVPSPLAAGAARSR
jgi:hypothetical protein